ncbi:MAG: hypothetical protein Q7J29_14460 [Stagnimonas sp.]|nr:hypothetical protein [Stagnimonas sp.]
MKNIVIKKPHDYKIHLIGAALTAVMLIGCSADEGGAVTVPGVPVPGTPNATPPTIGTLMATPNPVAAGATTTINYEATGAVSCVATGQWAGTTLSTSGTVVVTAPTVPGVYTYGVTCTNSTGQQTSQSINVTVVAAPSGDGSDVIGGDDGSLLPNDGTTPTDVTDGGTPIAGNFKCSSSARTYGNSPTTTVSLNGLLGGTVLTTLLDLLGAGTVTQLLNSVTAKENAVDRSLDTFAQYNLTAGLLTLPLVGNLVSSVDLVVGLNSKVPMGQYAVFGLTFPSATVEATLLQTLTVTTFNGTEVAETRDISLSSLDLLGLGLAGEPALFVGFKTTVPYDSVSINLDPSLLSVNVGNAMNVHELCTGGSFVAP